MFLTVLQLCNQSITFLSFLHLMLAPAFGWQVFCGRRGDSCLPPSLPPPEAAGTALPLPTGVVTTGFGGRSLLAGCSASCLFLLHSDSISWAKPVVKRLQEQEAAVSCTGIPTKSPSPRAGAAPSHPKSSRCFRAALIPLPVTSLSASRSCSNIPRLLMYLMLLFPLLQAPQRKKKNNETISGQCPLLHAGIPGRGTMFALSSSSPLLSAPGETI